MEGYSHWLRGVAISADVEAKTGALLPVSGFSGDSIGKLSLLLADSLTPRIHTLVVALEQRLDSGLDSTVSIIRARYIGEVAALLKSQFGALCSELLVDPSVEVVIASQKAMLEASPDCIGRTWLISLLMKRIVTKRCGYTLLEAGPGFGKSVVFSEILRRSTMGRLDSQVSVPAYHFFRARHSDDPSLAVRSICTQLCLHYGRLPQATDEVNQWFRETLNWLGEQVSGSANSVVILMGSIDELLPDTVKLPPLDVIPEGVHILLSSTPGDSFKALGLNRDDIDFVEVSDLLSEPEKQATNDAGIREFIDARCDALEADASALGVDVAFCEEVRQKLVHRSEHGFLVPSTLLRSGTAEGGEMDFTGLFTVVKRVKAWCYASKVQSEQLGALMRLEWDECLDSLLHRLEITGSKARNDLKQLCMFCLGVLFSLNRSPTRKQLIELFQLDNSPARYAGVEISAPDRLGRKSIAALHEFADDLGLGSYGLPNLPDHMGDLFWSMPDRDDWADNTQYRVFHSYFADWFLGSALPGDARVQVEQAVASRCMRALSQPDSSLHEYALRNTVFHLLRARQVHAAARLLCGSEEYIRLRLRATDNEHRHELERDCRDLIDLAGNIMDADMEERLDALRGHYATD
jgi:hypothetical protein